MMVPAAATTDTGSRVPERRRRMLSAAAAVFSEAGLGVPMATVAEAAEVGVGSLYRAYPSKADLIAAIVVEEMRSLRVEIEKSAASRNAGNALRGLLLQLVERQARNDLVRAALSASSEREEVRTAVAETSLAWQNLIDRARKEGRVRADITTGDLRLFFAAARAAEELGTGEGERMVELMMAALGFDQ